MLGRVNALWAEAAADAFFVVAGRALRLRSGRMAELDRPLAAIRPADRGRAGRGQRAFDFKTKPRGSLGRLEEIAVQIAAIRGESVPPRLEPAIVVAAGDHGFAARASAPTRSEVTAQMVANFAGGGAAINVLAREAGARLVVVDAGVAVPFDLPGVRTLRFGPGTANCRRAPR